MDGWHGGDMDMVIDVHIWLVDFLFETGKNLFWHHSFSKIPMNLLFLTIYSIFPPMFILQVWVGRGWFFTFATCSDLPVFSGPNPAAKSFPPSNLALTWGVAGSCHFCWPTWARGGSLVLFPGRDVWKILQMHLQNAWNMTASSNSGNMFLFFFYGLLKSILLCGGWFYFIYIQLGVQWANWLLLVINSRLGLKNSAKNGANHKLKAIRKENSFPLTSIASGKPTWLAGVFPHVRS